MFLQCFKSIVQSYPKKLCISHNLIVSENCKFRKGTQLLEEEINKWSMCCVAKKWLCCSKHCHSLDNISHFLRFVGNTTISLAILAQHICPWEKSYLDTKWPFFKDHTPKQNNQLITQPFPKATIEHHFARHVQRSQHTNLLDSHSIPTQRTLWLIEQEERTKTLST